MSLRLASINLMAPAGPFLAWGDRADNLAGALADKQPHIIAAQEATPESLDCFQNRFPNHRILGRGRWADGSGIQCAIIYDSRILELRDFGHFWLSDQPEKPGSKFRLMGSARVATWASFTFGERTFTFLNVHFSHLVRRQQARLILERLEQLPGPHLVAGDFNSTPWPTWSAHRILSTRLQDLADTAGATWNGGVGLPIARLDWVLGSFCFEPRKAEVMRVGESDHWPVLVDVKLAS